MQKQLFVVLILSVFLFSCKKEGPEPSPSSKQPLLEKADTVASYSKDQLVFFAQMAGQDQYTSYIETGVASLKVEYYTETGGTRILTSGMLYIPEHLSETTPILSFQHGTIFNKNDAPTQLQISPTLLLASAGYITFEPDYVGYGASAEYRHPYYDKESSGACVRDFLKAGKEFLDQHTLPYSPKLFLAGYSEGGYVSLAAQQILEEQSDSPLDFHLQAVAAGAGGYDLNNMLDTINLRTTYPNPGYLAFLVASYDSTYNWNKGFAYYFQEEYAVKLPNLLDGYHSAGTINSELTIYLDSLFNTSFYTNLQSGEEDFFPDALDKNSLTNWKPETPLRLYHGTDDEVVPYYNSVSTFNSFTSSGAGNVQMMPINGATHGTGFEFMLQDFLPWFESLN